MKNLKSISNKLNKIDKKVYIVGGYTREKFLGLNYNGDIDLATNATPLEMQDVLNIVQEVGKKYGTLIIKEGGKIFEITTFRNDIGILDNRKPVDVVFTDDLIKDSNRRDFTCNAIYYDINNDKYIDPQDGISDIKNNIIKFIGNPIDRIQEDALRILRFIRIKNKYNFKLYDKKYINILKENIGLLKNISIERIKSEFDKILLLKNNIQALKDLKNIGFFKIFIPDVDKLEQIEGGPKHHLEGNVWVHTLLSIEELNKLFKNGLDGIDINNFNNSKLDFYRTLLLHDIGKIETYSKDNNGNVHYYNHEIISYEKSKYYLKKFKFSKASTKLILWMIKNHLRIFKINNMRILKARKFMMDKFFGSLIIIGICDYKGKIPNDKQIITKLLDFYNNFLEILKTKKFLTGKDILEKYPNLKGIEIKNKITSLNDEILIKD